MEIKNLYKQKTFIALSLFCIIGLMYWKGLTLPFISDDWWFVREFQASNGEELLKFYFNPVGKIVFRPLAETSMFLMYKVFGFELTPIRFLGLIVHFLNSYLVVLIIGHVLKNRFIGYMAGLVYAAAIAVHLDLLTWAWISYYDLGASLFFFLSIWTYLKNRITPSAVFYFLGCLYKESIVLLPVILFLYSLFYAIEKTNVELFFNAFKKMILFAFLGGIILSVKFLGNSNPSALGQDHPYFIDFVGNHLISNLESYIVWMLQSIFPFFTLELRFSGVLIIVLFVCVIGYSAFLLKEKQFQELGLIFFLFIWMVVGLLPVYFLPNHTYRYYAIYSLPAFIAMFFYAVGALLAVIKVKQRIVNIVFVLLIITAVFGSLYQSRKIYSEGLQQHTFADGTNLLIRRAATVSLVMPRLEKDFPSIPPGFVIVLVNADLGAFGFDNRAIQYLYNFDAFEVLPPSAISYENGDWFFTTPDSAPRYLDPSLVVVYELIENDIVRRDLDDLVQPENVP